MPGCKILRRTKFMQCGKLLNSLSLISGTPFALVPPVTILTKGTFHESTSLKISSVSGGRW